MQYDDISRIRQAYPDLSIQSAYLFADSGQFSKVYVVNDSLIFRFPRSIYVARQMTREISILRSIQHQVPLPVPDPTYSATDSQTGLVTLMGYTRIPGDATLSTTLDHQDEAIVKRFARQLAGFLKALHSIPPASHGLDFPVEGTHDDWLTLYAEFREKLFPFMRPDAQQSVRNTFETALNEPALWQFTPVLRHGDFGTRNILHDPQTMSVTGIVDFSEAGPGDPAQDVGAVWSLGDKLMPHFFDAYPEMLATLPRVKFIRSTYALQQALYALRDGNQDDFDDGIQAYR